MRSIAVSTLILLLSTSVNAGDDTHQRRQTESTKEESSEEIRNLYSRHHHYRHHYEAHRAPQNNYNYHNKNYNQDRSETFKAKESKEGVSKEARIIGGDLSNIGEFPYYVALKGCGGSLIAPNVVLTAAHCGSQFGKSAIVGGYHAERVGVGNAVEAEVVHEAAHPLYDADTTVNDFHLLKLSDSAANYHPPHTPHSIPRLVLNENPYVPEPGQYLTVLGLGNTNSDPDAEYQGAVRLRDVEVHAVDHATCNHPYEGEIDDATMFCAGVDDFSKDACQGDSGGPIVIRNGNEHIQVGVVSWGAGCALQNFPGVYARVSHAMEWIKSVVCDCWDMADEASFCEGYTGYDESRECPTHSPTIYVSPQCQDYEGFEDEFGDGCSWYEENEQIGCSDYGAEVNGTATYVHGNVTAAEACCFCGGGYD